jgi:hypothetical protein
MAEYLAGEVPRRRISRPTTSRSFRTSSRWTRPRCWWSVIVGDGKSTKKPIVVMAHMDVVTARREEWERDPYQLVEENGFFYGRGTADIKSGVAGLTATFLRLRQEGFKPSRDLIIYFSGDEETAQDTTVVTVRDHRDLIDAEYALNSDAGGGVLDDDTGKPLFFSLQAAEKTYADFTLTAHNPGGHSSQPRPDNAIYDLANALARVQAYEFPVMTNDITIAQLPCRGQVHAGRAGSGDVEVRRESERRRGGGRDCEESGRRRHVRTTCVADAPRRRPRQQRLAADRDGQRQLPHLSRRESGRRGGEAAGGGGSGVEVKESARPCPATPRHCANDLFAAGDSRGATAASGVPVVPDQASAPPTAWCSEPREFPPMAWAASSCGPRMISRTASTSASRSTASTRASITGTCCSRIWRGGPVTRMSAPAAPLGTLEVALAHAQRLLARDPARRPSRPRRS